MCWGPLVQRLTYNYWYCDRCSKSIDYEDMMHANMVVVVWDKTRQYSAIIHCADLKLTGNMRGIVSSGPHIGMEWRRDT